MHTKVRPPEAKFTIRLRIKSKFNWPVGYVTYVQGVTKRCRLTWLTNGALVYEPKCGGRGGVEGYQPMSTAVHRSPNKLGDLTQYLTNDRRYGSVDSDKT